MAISNSNSKTIYASASSTYGYTLKTEFTETSTDTTNNTSTISCSASIGSSTISFNVTNGGTLSVYWHDNNTNTDTLVNSLVVSKCGNGGGNNYGTKTTSGTITATHKSDGTLNGYTIATWSKDKSGSYIPNDNSVETDWTTLTNIPRGATLLTAPNFTDLQNPTITYSNPAGSSVTSLQACISLVVATDDVPYRDIPKNGSSYTFNLTDTERNTLINAITTGNSRTLRFYVKTIIGGSTLYSSKDVTFTLVDANPTIASITYDDTNPTTYALTNNNQIIIQNKSTLNFDFTTISARKNATLSSVKININGNVQTQSLSGSSVATLSYLYGVVDVAENTTATITLTDSRGLTTTYTKQITMWEYSSPTAIITTYRDNNFYTSSKINVDANYSSLGGNNTIVIRYRIKKSTENSWGNWVTINDNTLTSFNADNEYAWDVQVEVEDALNSSQTYTINKALDVGIPIVFYDVAKRSVGINTFPKNDATLEVSGDIYLNDEKVKQRHIAVVTLDGDITLNVHTNYNVSTITSLNTTGTKLSVTTDGVVIGAGVSKVLISATGTYKTLSNNTTYDRYIKLKVNTTEVANTKAGNSLSSHPLSMSIAPFLVDVQQGDVIGFAIQGAENDVFYGTSVWTHICVEVIE